MDEVSIALVLGLGVPFAGTVIGASFALFMKREPDERIQKALAGFAAGIMIAASIWSLITPSIEMAAEQGIISWLPAAVGFIAGMALLLLVDSLLPHLHVDSKEPEGRPSGLKRPTMLFLAITIHNFPEGMAVGVVLAGFLAGDVGISLAGLVALVVGIAVQNVPEGAIVSMPLVTSCMSRGKAFLYGVASGVVEPLGAALMVLVTSLVNPILPYVLSFAAGAMVYVVVEELIPETQSGRHTNIGTIGVAIGFVLMMVLDVALG